MKKEAIKIIVNGKTVLGFEAHCIEIRYEGDKTWYSVQGVACCPKPKKKARRG